MSTRESQATALFWTFLVIFVLTFLITAFGITDVLTVSDVYLRPLFVALILEVVGGIVYLFRCRMGLVSLRVALDFGDSIPEVAPTVCSCTIAPRGSEQEPKIVRLNVVTTPGAPVVTLPDFAVEAESVQLEVSSDGKIWRTAPFSPAMYSQDMALQP